MGRQINFYMGPEDTQEFESYLKKSGEIRFIYDRMESKELVFAESIAIRPPYPQGYLLVREQDLDKIVVEQLRDDLWYVTQLYSPVLEFMDCFYDGALVGRGRVYYQTNYFDDDDSLITKASDFIKWGDKVCRWSRSHYEMHPSIDWYVGPHTWKWHLEGGILRP